MFAVKAKLTNYTPPTCTILKDDSSEIAYVMLKTERQFTTGETVTLPSIHITEI